VEGSIEDNMEERLDGVMLAEQEYVEAHAELVEAWGETLYLDRATEYGAPKLETDYQRAMMAQICENYKKEGNAGKWRNMPPMAALEASGNLIEATTPTKTTAWSGATNLPLVLGYVRQMMPKVMGLELVQIQVLDRPAGRVFYLDRKRHDDGTTGDILESRAGWSYRSWIDDPGEATTITKSVTMTLTSADVSVASHKLKAETSIEFEQDLRAYHNMDGRALLAEAATDEMAMELSERILWRLWNAYGTKVQYGGNPDTTQYTNNSWELRFLEAWNRADELAFNKRRTRTNWAVVGAEGAMILAILPQTIGIPEGDRPVGDAMLQRLGTLNSRWNVYVSAKPWPENDTLLGYKGTNWTDACMFYLPYVPLMVAGTHFDPDKQTWIISWLSRDTIYKPTDGGNGLALVTIDKTNITGISYPAWTEYS